MHLECSRAGGGLNWALGAGYRVNVPVIIPVRIDSEGKDAYVNVLRVLWKFEEPSSAPSLYVYTSL